MMILPFTHKLLKMIFFIFNSDRKGLITAVELKYFYKINITAVLYQRLVAPGA